MKARKIALVSLVVMFSLVLTVPLTRGFFLDVDVSVYPEVISPDQKVSIICRAEMAGEGIVFVIQPVSASSEAQSQSENCKNGLNEISKDPDGLLWKIISYARVAIVDPAAKQEFVFPDDFTGLNGEPSTSVSGKYYIFFVFWHSSECFCIKIGFDCAMFSVIPEYPFGTIAAMVAFFGATGLYVSRKKHPVK